MESTNQDVTQQSLQIGQQTYPPNLIGNKVSDDEMDNAPFLEQLFAKNRHLLLDTERKLSNFQLASRDHILIEGAEEKLAVFLKSHKRQTGQLGSRDKSVWEASVKPSIEWVFNVHRRDPKYPMHDTSDFKLRVCSIRRVISKLNEQLRDQPKTMYPDENLAQQYQDACRKLYYLIRKNFQPKGADPDERFFDNGLTDAFFDVSKEAKKVPPVAIYVTGEACEEARSWLQKVDWFSANNAMYHKPPAGKYPEYYGSTTETPMKHRNPNVYRTTKDVLSKHDFYIQWKDPNPIIKSQNTPVQCYWRCKLQSKDHIFQHDYRLQKVRDVMTDSAMIELATMLFDSAVDFEFYGLEKNEMIDKKKSPPMEHPLVSYQYKQAPRWFQLFAKMPYDATDHIEALLDCLRLVMKYRELEELYMVEAVQIGFPFSRHNYRRLWVRVIENLLYNFNIQTKYMMPFPVEPEALQTLNRFSDQRAVDNRIEAPMFDIYLANDTEADKNPIPKALRYMSQPNLLKSLVGRDCERFSLKDLLQWQARVSLARDNFKLFTVAPLERPPRPILYSAKELAVQWNSQAGQVDKTKRLVPFLVSLSATMPGMHILTRYYVASCITGAHHLFVVKFVNNEQLWPKMFTTTSQPRFLRTDTKNYLQWYLGFMYEQVGVLPPEGPLQPSMVLDVASSFWYRCFGAQDTMMFCLEVQQLWLYYFYRRKLDRAVTHLRQQPTSSWNKNAKNLLIDVLRIVMVNLTQTWENERPIFQDLQMRLLMLHAVCIEIQERFSVVFNQYSSISSHCVDEPDTDGFEAVHWGNILMQGNHMGDFVQEDADFRGVYSKNNLPSHCLEKCTEYTRAVSEGNKQKQQELKDLAVKTDQNTFKWLTQFQKDLRKKDATLMKEPDRWTSIEDFHNDMHELEYTVRGLPALIRGAQSQLKNYSFHEDCPELQQRYDDVLNTVFTYQQNIFPQTAMRLNLATAQGDEGNQVPKQQQQKQNKDAKPVQQQQQIQSTSPKQSGIEQYMNKPVEQPSTLELNKAMIDSDQQNHQDDKGDETHIDASMIDEQKVARQQQNQRIENMGQNQPLEQNNLPHNAPSPGEIQAKNESDILMSEDNAEQPQILLQNQLQPQPVAVPSLSEAAAGNGPVVTDSEASNGMEIDQQTVLVPAGQQQADNIVPQHNKSEESIVGEHQEQANPFANPSNQVPSVVPSISGAADSNQGAIKQSYEQSKGVIEEEKQEIPTDENAQLLIACLGTLGDQNQYKSRIHKRKDIIGRWRLQVFTSLLIDKKKGTLSGDAILDLAVETIVRVRESYRGDFEHDAKRKINE